jgi:hypothetical protein
MAPSVSSNAESLPTRRKVLADPRSDSEPSNPRVEAHVDPDPWRDAELRLDSWLAKSRVRRALSTRVVNYLTLPYARALLSHRGKFTHGRSARADRNGTSGSGN